MNDGWFGLRSQVLNYLSVVGADRDAEGRYLIAGNAAVGLDPEEMIVGADAVFFRDGKPCPLAAGLNETSYGLRVTVI